MSTAIGDEGDREINTFTRIHSAEVCYFLYQTFLKLRVDGGVTHDDKTSPTQSTEQIIEQLNGHVVMQQLQESYFNLDIVLDREYVEHLTLIQTSFWIENMWNTYPFMKFFLEI